MSSTPHLPDDREALAAEYALGVLEGEELAKAIELERSDAAFRSAVDRWNGRFAPLFDGVAPVEPPAQAFAAIEQRVGTASDASNDNVIVLRRRLNRWRTFAAGAAALAASLTLVLITRPPSEVAPPTTISTPTMVAVIEGDQVKAPMVATWSASDRSLKVVPTAVAALDPAHSRELWMIPPDGKPRSMGVMPIGPMHVTVDASLAKQLGEGVVLAVSLEPVGGSPTGAPTGPVLASGKLQRA